MTEQQLQAAIVEAAQALGWLVYHTYDSRRSHAGFPDLVLVRQPRLIFAELKDDTRPMTEEQVRWSAGLLGVSQVVRSLIDDDVWRDRPPLVSWHLWRPVHWTTGEVEKQLRAKVLG